jgi:hypothetical protein
MKVIVQIREPTQFLAALPGKHGTILCYYQISVGDNKIKYLTLKYYVLCSELPSLSSTESSLSNGHN